VRDRSAAALTAFRAAVKPRHFGRGYSSGEGRLA
jgi:hypothetical protein